MLYYSDVFTTSHCEAKTQGGTVCKMVAIYVDKRTKKRLCNVHARRRYLELFKAKQEAANA